MSLAAHASSIPAPTTHVSSAPTSTRRRWPVWTVRAALLLWAAFWCWFASAEIIAEINKHGWQGFTQGWPHFLTIAGPIALCTLITFRWPRVGGTLLILGGIFAAIGFHNPFARAFFAAPPIVLGLASIWLGSRR